MKVYFLEDLVGRPWLRQRGVSVVPSDDELADFRVEVVHAREYPAADSLLVGDPEPHLDEVQPRIRRREWSALEPQVLL